MVKSQNLKFLTFSFMIHSALFLLYMLYRLNNQDTLHNEAKSITMELEYITVSNTPAFKPIVPLVQPKPIVQQIANQEVTEPTRMPKVEPEISQQIIEPKLQITPSPVHKIVKPIVVAPKTLQRPKPIVHRLPSKVTGSVTTKTLSSLSSSAKAKSISKTDFKIIRDKVFSHLLYPSIAKRMSWQGVVHIAITIDTKGKIVTAKIAQSSGKSILDKAALQAVYELKNHHLPKPQSTTTLILPVAFKLKQ
jgi:protein TonB